jgi:hypothetical protein
MSEEASFLPAGEENIPAIPQEECYAGLSAESIQSLEYIDTRIKAVTTQAAIEVGKLLADAREIYRHQKHGGFEGWITTKFGWERTKAYRLIWRYEQFGAVANLQQLDMVLSAQYHLSAPSVPQSARDEALQRAQAGEKITLSLAKEIIEAQQAQKRAEEAEQIAREEVQRTQQRLAEMEAQTREEMTSLTQRLVTLQEEMASLSTPVVEIREIEKAVVPPEVTAKLEYLQARIQEVTEQRDNLSRKAQQLGADLVALREATEAEREQEAQEARIRHQWHQVTDAFRQRLLQLLGQLPSPLDARVFEADDWDRLAQLEEGAQRLLMECRALRETPGRLIVDAE